MANDGDVLLSVRAPVGDVNLAVEKCCIGRGLSALSMKNGNKEFLYYLIQHNRQRLKQTFESEGTVFGCVNKNGLRNFEVLLPDSESEQGAIAKILGDLDEKIELNHRMNKTLEAIAQAIFKRWFVDFEFPECESIKLVNGLPEGWREGTLGEVIKIESGKRPGEKLEIKTQEFSVPLLGASSVMGFVKDSLYAEPILIIGRVGTHGVVQRVSYPSFPSDNTLVIRSDYFEFVYQILKTIDYEALNVGTTQPLITQTSINNYSMVLPQLSVLDGYTNAVSGLFEKIESNLTENETLIEVRDSLLPKLMSGKVRIKI
jgi:type I restriction enzyme S subunit